MQSSPLFNFRTFSSPPKETPYLLEVIPLLPAPQPQATVTSFLSLRIFLLWTFHVNEIISRVLFWDWLLLLSMFSRFIHVVTCISTSFLFNGRIIVHCMDIPHFVYPLHLMDVWVVCKVHSCYNMYQYSIPFYGWITFYCIDIPHFVYPLFSWWTFGLFPLWIMNNTAMNIPTKVSIWTYIPSTIKSRAVSSSQILTEFK